ncbi:glycosyltransferase family 4 protein [Anabaena azotica]|uniref:Glycosyltransferase family 4 protein n=1 Tax=Anabaena azotica FACHB-119 TaxID=947527 RepID=A0ABR8D8Y6_9NOST|nr:glycosyltransferase family 4 protein [Anabaena azotica]MBD2503658.1 glycosyltransferase family 4 protein [Anabaena azotica FACHB-119]
MKVIHITPSYFDDVSIIGGGERYPTELASWMSRFVDTTLVSFSSERKSYTQGKLKCETYAVKKFIKGSKINPLCFKYLATIFNADIIHIHNIHTLVSDVACLAASFLNKRVFVTDHGGGSSFYINHKLPVFRGYRQAIAQSQFALDFLPTTLSKKAIVAKGGVDIEKFCPDASLKKAHKILYVGRILPHKGINYLLEAFRLLNHSNYKLTIVGRVYSEQFYQDLKQLADGLNVEFIHDADDQRLLHEYRAAMVTVLPSVHKNCYGEYTPVPELMGLTLLESQACGTPVICTDAGAMSEFVDDHCTGFVVKQNSGEAIASALHQIVHLSPTEYAGYQTRCREWIEPLSWSTVVKKHLDIYQNGQ